MEGPARLAASFYCDDTENVDFPNRWSILTAYRWAGRGGAMVWYVAREGETFGPFSFEVLVGGVRQGEMRPDDFVWSNGMPEWVPAQTISGLWVPPSLRSLSIEKAGTSSAAHDPRPVVTARASNESKQLSAERVRPRSQPTNVGLIRRHWRGDLSLPDES